jgi:hypothetical protein
LLADEDMTHINTFLGMSQRFDADYSKQQQANNGIQTVAGTASKPEPTDGKKSKGRDLVRKASSSTSSNSINSLQQDLQALQLVEPQELQPNPLQNVCDFLEKLKLNRETEEASHGQQSGELLDAVNLMTMHASKVSWNLLGPVKDNKGPSKPHLMPVSQNAMASNVQALLESNVIASTLL